MQKGVITVADNIAALLGVVVRTGCTLLLISLLLV